MSLLSKQSQHASKISAELTSLYNWMRLTRKSNSRAADVSLLFKLLNVPLNQNEKKIFLQIIDKQRSSKNAQKQQIQLDQFLDCFIIPEDHRKPKEKQLKQAFRYIVESNQRKQTSLRNTQVMSQTNYSQFMKTDKANQKADDRIDFLALGYEQQFTNSVLKQLEQWDDSDGNFKFKDFADSLYS